MTHSGHDVPVQKRSRAEELESLPLNIIRVLLSLVEDGDHPGELPRVGLQVRGARLLEINPERVSSFINREIIIISYKYLKQRRENMGIYSSRKTLSFHRQEFPKSLNY